LDLNFPPLNEKYSNRVPAEKDLSMQKQGKALKFRFQV